MTENPDADAGLWIKKRSGEEFRARFPKDCIAFQIGQSSQVMTGGQLMATPHAVQMVKHPLSENVGRCTFAVFMQPDNLYAMGPKGKKENGDDFTSDDIAVAQYAEGQNFADFTVETVKMYYS